MSSETRRRIAFIDWARFAALALMVFGHVQDAVLANEARASLGYAVYDHFRGYTAPLFMLLSGMAFMVSTEASFADYTRPSFNLFRRMARVVALLAVGYALSAPHDEWPELLAMTPAELAVFWRCNVLQCIAVALFVAHAAVFAARTPRRSAIALGAVAAALVLATPFVTAAGFARGLPLPLAQALTHEGGSFFPLTPWAAYFFAGAAIASALTGGAVVGTGAPSAALGGTGAPSAALGERPFLRAAALWGTLVAVACASAAFAHGWLLDPADNYRSQGIVIFAGRLAGALAITGALGLALGRVPRIVTMVTRSSLTVYVAHLLLAWGSPWNEGLAQIAWRRYGLGETAAAAAVVFASSAAVGVLAEALARLPAALRAEAPVSYRRWRSSRPDAAPRLRAPAASPPPPAA